ncbi:MAG: flagellin lysine-N-methylase [Clostridia bacterium]|nr:flagellin lysine-N-methylase [Clostridia bacterium]
MRMEYPKYYERFACTEGTCEDSCCARWEIDVDEESYYRYQTVQGPFGDRIRGCIHTEVVEDEDGTHEEWSFPLTEDRRCPFLNDKDLCDMYIALGHDKLPRTCREFPRGDAVVGNYHQIDVALACPEANRLIFEDLDKPVDYVIREEPTGVPALDRYCAPEEEKLDTESWGKLLDLLDERNQVLAMLQDTKLPVSERYAILFSLSSEYGYSPLDESHTDLVERIDRMELLDERWSAVYDPVKRAMDTGFPSEDLLDVITEGSVVEQELIRFLVYLVFRYYIDGYFEGSMTGVFRLLLRGFHMMRLLLAALSPEDLENADTRRALYRVWSREVEHSPENFGIIKAE